MITVTAIAKRKFKEILQNQTKDPEVAIRIKTSSQAPNQLEFVLDKEKKEDYVVKNGNGTKLLLIAPDSLPSLAGAIIGYQKTSLISGFIIEKLGSDTS